MSGEKKAYWAAIREDEGVGGRDTPDAWLARRPDGQPCIAPHYEGEEPRADEDILTDGERVCFSTTLRIGTGVVTMGEEGEWTVDVQPPATTGFVVAPYEWETATDSLTTLVEEERINGALDAGEKLDVWYFELGQEWHVFDAASFSFRLAAAEEVA